MLGSADSSNRNEKIQCHSKGTEGNNSVCGAKLIEDYIFTKHETKQNKEK